MKFKKQSFYFNLSSSSIHNNLINDFLFLLYFQDTKLRQIVTMGSQDTLEEKTVTVCFGGDFVNVTFVSFCCTRKEIAQVSFLFLYLFLFFLL